MSAAQTRAAARFLVADEADKDLSLRDLLADEKTRTPAPNRAALRRAGIRSGYARKIRLAFAAERMEKARLRRLAEELIALEEDSRVPA